MTRSAWRGRLLILCFGVAGLAAQSQDRGSLILADQGVVRGVQLNHPVSTYLSQFHPFNPEGSPFQAYMAARPGIPTFLSADSQVAIRAVNGEVAEIVSVSPTALTERLVKPGIPAAAVVRAYGEPATIIKSRCGLRLDYVAKQFLLGFWVCTGPTASADALLSSQVGAISLARSDIDAFDAIAGVLQGYETAYSSLDLEAVCKLRSNCNRAELKSQFQNLKSFSLKLDVQKLTVDGARGMAEAVQNETFQPKVGHSGKLSARATIELARAPGGWVITGIR